MLVALFKEKHVRLSSSFGRLGQTDYTDECRKLKDFAIRIFITTDESIQVRREKALERWKSRAEKDGKSVEVRDGILSVDGI